MATNGGSEQADVADRASSKVQATRETVVRSSRSLGWLTDCWRAVINQVKHVSSVISISERKSVPLIAEHLFISRLVCCLFVRSSSLKRIYLLKAIMSIRVCALVKALLYTHWTAAAAADISLSLPWKENRRSTANIFERKRVYLTIELFVGENERIDRTTVSPCAGRRREKSDSYFSLSRSDSLPRVDSFVEFIWEKHSLDRTTYSTL